MTLRLIALAGPLRGETVLLAEEAVTIGRRPSNRVHPDDLALSRQHCVVAVGDARATVTDLQSSNGTFVNGVPIQERVLEHGDQLKIGESVFVFLDRETAETVPPAVEFNQIVHRLKVVTFSMPALRDRREDIPLLAAFFLTRFSAKCKRRLIGLTDEARSCLARYDWPGNVRELENAIERAVVLGSADRIRLDDLPENILEPGMEEHGAAKNFHQAVQSAKRQIVTAALAYASGNHAAAARQLGLHPNNLHRLIRNLNLKDLVEN